MTYIGFDNGVEKRVYIGFDNGVTGGIVALSELGQVIFSAPMPAQRARRGQEINVRDVRQLLEPVAPWDQQTWIAEEPSGSPNAKIAASMAASFAAIRAAADWQRVKFVRITPQSWQKVMLGKVAAGETKAMALTRARELWPMEDFRASPRCTVQHGGIVDAVLIAEFGRRTNL